jgi:chaperonin GroEL
MSKEILFGSESRNKLKAGIDKLADAVKVTYGSKGRTVIISREYGEPHITKDGVTVARSVESSDSIENTGVELMKSIASKTAEIAGDGTTTATVLAQAIISNGFKLIAAGANPVELKKGIDKGVEKVISYLKDKSETVTDEKLIQIATVSSNGDSEIGQLIGNAYAKIGKDGIIDVQDSPNYETFITVVEGLNFDRGFISPYFKNSMEKDICVFENAYILFVDRRISMFEDITPLLEKIVDSKRPLLIVSEDLTDNALNALVVNRMRSGLPVCAVKSPGFGDRRRELLEDMAIITGGKVFSENEDLKLAEIDDLGYAKKILIDRNSTTIIGGNGDSNLIDERVLNVRNKISDTVSEYDKEKLEERLAKLTGGVAVLNVGAPSEVELKEKKDRIDDAVRATKGAIQEGISVG